MSECRKNPPKVLQVTCCDQPTLFHLVEIPASVGDETTIPPVPGLYRNVLLVYESSGNGYIYTSDGMPVKVKDQQELATLRAMLEEEILDRENADEAIWDEIEKIELSSDVVDIVGTYADLQSYDTTNLQDNDIIKVLQDETHDGAISYYRWNKTTQTFSYVGEEGPYYTQTQTDTLLSGKQDKLIAGSNIQIASDGKTISATDTTYTHFTGATSSTDGVQGLVPGPLAGDEAKVLKGDGTWGEAAANTIFYRNASETGSTRHIYKNADMTGTVSMQDILDANEKGQVILRLSTASHPEDFSDAYLQNAYVGTNDYQMLFLDEKAYSSFDTTNATDTTFYYGRRELQDKLTAGTNIQINGTTISATDTTYSAFTGATSQDAGVAGLVPAPAAGDNMKYLSGDGTWKTINTSSVTVFFYNYNDPTARALYSDSAMTTAVRGVDVEAAFYRGKVIVYYKNRPNGNIYVEATNLEYSRWVPDNIRIWMAMVSGTYTPSTDCFYYSDKMTTTCSRGTTTLQAPLIAGSNISIFNGPDGPIISATDTTYSAFTGATSSVAGSAGLVPAPTTSDPDKFLKGDGTWGAVTTNALLIKEWS